MGLMKPSYCTRRRKSANVLVLVVISFLTMICISLLLFDQQTVITLEKVLRKLNDTPCFQQRIWSVPVNDQSKIHDVVFPNNDNFNRHLLQEAGTSAYRIDGDERQFTYLNHPENLCPKNGTEVVLFVAVFVRADDFPLRKYIRATWGKAARKNTKVRLLFLLGIPPKPFDYSSKIKAESHCYQDILQTDFIDKYRNLTLKSLSVYRWIRTYCSQAQFVLKIDSDISIDLDHLVSMLESNHFPDCFLCGQIFTNASVERNNKSDWYVSKEHWGSQMFPHYCLGAAFVISRRIATGLSLVPIPWKPFPVDDAFVTGIWRFENKECYLGNFLAWNHHKGKILLPNGFGIARVSINKCFNENKTNDFVCR